VIVHQLSEPADLEPEIRQPVQRRRQVHAETTFDRRQPLIQFIVRCRPGSVPARSTTKAGRRQPPFETGSSLPEDLRNPRER
jgi:hypothetical protein